MRVLSRESAGVSEPLLSVRGLKVHVPAGRGWTGRRGVVRAVDGVDLDMHRGEVLGLVGESGSGKTTLGRSVLRLVEPSAGSVRLAGTDLLALEGRGLRGVRRRIQIVFQDPYSSLSPRMQGGEIIAEPLRVHRIVPTARVGDRVRELLGRVGLEPRFEHLYPHEMSGGQRQRIALARALAPEPELLVADEPTSALDVSVQARLLGLFLDLKRSHRLAMLFISHDLRVVERIADRIAVMVEGRIVELAPANRLAATPRHPYTRALLSAVTSPQMGEERLRIRPRGETPTSAGDRVGCPFAPRCPIVEETCRTVTPRLAEKEAGHRVACHRVPPGSAQTPSPA